jgi:hypothetical protein
MIGPMPMTDAIEALNAIGERAASYDYDGAQELAERLDHKVLAAITVALVRMHSESQVEFLICQGLSEDAARNQAAGFYRAMLGFPRKVS